MINIVYFTALILVVIRLICFFSLVPVFFPKGTPNFLKIALSIILAYILMPGINYSIVKAINTTPLFIAECINEVLTGLSLGFITNLCFMGARYAGNMMDMQIGFSMMTMFDPTANSNTTLIERLMYSASLVLFLIVDGHHMLIRALIESFNAVSLGRFILVPDSINVIVKAFVQFFSIGLKIAIPIVLIIIITDLTMGLIARTVPQLNVMILGMPVKILIGMTCVAVALPIFFKIIEGSFIQLPDIFKNFYKTVPLLLVFASDEKSEDATPHKLSDSKKKGQVAKSKEVSLAFTLLAATMVLSLLGSYAIQNLASNFVFFIGNPFIKGIDEGSLLKIMITVVIRLGIVILPMILPIMLMGVLSNFMQTGFIFTKETLKPDLKKLNPINGFKKMFSLRTVFELIKDISIVTIVGYVGYNYVKDSYTLLLNYSNLSIMGILQGFGKLVVGIFFKITLVMITIAILDFTYQKLQFKKEMKMSKQEVKEEYKQEEGDPVIKGKLRQKQREMTMGRMMQAVPKATVVVTNPTHISVALMYNDGESEAPIVVAKGVDFMALKIKEKAVEFDIPVIEDKPLARLIYENVEINDEIPGNMYQAVAQILAIVYKLKKRK